DGKIKAAGKTTWLLAMVRRILDGEPFMGQPTRRSGAVLLTEQTLRSIRVALARADLLDRDDLVLLFWHNASSASWPAIVAAARAEATRRGFEVLAVDTLGQFCGITGDSENNSGA